MTAFSERELIQEATDLPIHGYLVKPVNEGALTAAIAVAMKRFEEARRLQDEVDGLEEKLAARRLVEQAKARLMAGGMDEAAAYATIQRRARAGRQSMAEVARTILRE